MPSSLDEICEGAFQDCWNFAEYNVAEANETYASQDGILYDKTKKILLSCPQKKGLTIDIPEGVTKIATWAFGGSEEVVRLPESLTEIETAAFEFSSIKNVTIPSRVTSIGHAPFYSCNQLTNIIVEDANENYTAVDNILYTKDKKKLIQCPGGVGGIITIPEGVKEIEGEAFKYNEKLKEIYLPDGLTKIGRLAFDDCRALEKIVVSYGITYLDWAVFSSDSLISITLPASIEGIFDKDSLGGNADIYVVEDSYMHKWLLDNWDITKVHVIEKCEEHNYNDWVTTKEANCGIAGIKEQKCKVCGDTNKKEIPAIGNHTYGEWTVTQQPTSDKKGIRTRKCTICAKEETEEIPATGNSEETKPDKEEETGGRTTGNEETKNPEQPQTTDTQKPEQSESTGQPVVEYKEGTDFNKGNDSYEVVSVDGNKGTVVYTGTVAKNKKTITVPKSVTVDGKTFAVTEIADNAFKGNTKLTNVTVSTNITKIGKNTFSGCKNLKKITIKSTKLKEVGKNAFKGIHKKAVIKVPKKQLAKYKKLLKNKGQAKMVKIKK